MSRVEEAKEEVKEREAANHSNQQHVTPVIITVIITDFMSDVFLHSSVILHHSSFTSSTITHAEH